MKTYRMDIKFKNSRWLVNGKRLECLNHDERVFMDNFFREVKLSEIEDNDETHHFINRKASDQNASIKYAELLK